MTIYAQILCQKDYLCHIGKYLRIRELLCSLAALTKYHYYEWINDESQLPVIRKCLYNDFGNIICLLCLDLQFNCNNICDSVRHIYTDYHLWQQSAFNNKFGVSVYPKQKPNEFRMDLLFKIKKFEIVYHWMIHVCFGMIITLSFCDKIINQQKINNMIIIVS